MASRRKFIKQSALGGVALALPLFSDAKAPFVVLRPSVLGPNISLAQWSLHRALEKGELKPVDFPMRAKNEFGISAVEYVNEFYKSELEKPAFWKTLKKQTDGEGIENLLIMVDGEGELGAPGEKERTQAVVQHRRWLEAAQMLGCHSIRVNAFGKGDRKALSAALVDGLGALAEAGSDAGINILIENHGLHTSDAEFITGIVQQVNNPRLGTLPDFGNWCLNREWGGTKDGVCSDSYDPVKGLQEMLPFAKGVSAKSYDFSSDGQETRLPYKTLLQKVKDSGFTGYIGIEYEGDRLSEAEGIRATKALIENIWETLD
jgi:sugar phosphate isomerase/epimerase